LDKPFTLLYGLRKDIWQTVKKSRDLPSINAISAEEEDDFIESTKFLQEMSAEMELGMQIERVKFLGLTVPQQPESDDQIHKEVPVNDQEILMITKAFSQAETGTKVQGIQVNDEVVPKDPRIEVYTQNLFHQFGDTVSVGNVERSTCKR
jgi:hypothetical protein